MTAFTLMSEASMPEGALPILSSAGTQGWVWVDDLSTAQILAGQLYAYGSHIKSLDDLKPVVGMTFIRGMWRQTQSTTTARNPYKLMAVEEWIDRAHKDGVCPNYFTEASAKKVLAKDFGKLEVVIEAVNQVTDSNLVVLDKEKHSEAGQLASVILSYAEWDIQNGHTYSASKINPTLRGQVLARLRSKYSPPVPTFLD